VPDAQVMSDLDASIAWASGNGGSMEKFGITGFCWGGRIVWLYAAHSAKVKAGAAWYGRLSGATSTITPKNPIDVVRELKAPVLGLYGGKDTGIPLDQVGQMQTALKASGGKSMIQVYPDGPHGFNADYRPSYREADAKDAWSRMLAWFKKHNVQ
jgi:carboxymethylenebutenolidase